MKRNAASGLFTKPSDMDLPPVSDITVFIRAFADFRIVLGAQTEVLLAQGRTVKDLLEVLCDKHKGFREKVFDSEGRLSEGIEIVIDGRNVGNEHSLDRALHDGEQVFLFPSLSGG